MSPRNGGVAVVGAVDGFLILALVALDQLNDILIPCTFTHLCWRSHLKAPAINFTPRDQAFSPDGGLIHTLFTHTRARWTHTF